MVREFHPKLSDVSTGTPAVTGFSRADAQLVTARRYGFASWPRLRAYMDVVARYTRAPHRVAGEEPGDGTRAGEFLRLACLTHGGDDPGRWRRAAELIAAHPELTRASIHVAAAVGDVAATREWLARDAAAARQEGGPHHWEPILYLAYSAIEDSAVDEGAVDEGANHDRVLGRSHLETARLLLDAGADPAAGYLWEGLSPPYTALTGALTSGHAQPVELARLLLERGADANDSQLLYEIGLDGSGDDPTVLELLYEFGLGTGDGGVWHARLAPHHPSLAELVQEELIKAAGGNRPRQACLILSHPVDPAGLGDRHPIHEGRTAWEHAMLNGHTDVTAILAAAGAKPSTPDPELEFLGVCMRADRAAVDRLRAADPGVVARAIARHPGQLSAAAGQDRFDAVRLMTGLGFDVNAVIRYPHQQTALHGAAFNGNLAMVKYLVGRGADPAAEDCSFHATPLGWAEHNNQRPVADYLASLPG
jgi:ankyrin repeat protein